MGFRVTRHHPLYGRQLSQDDWPALHRSLKDKSQQVLGWRVFVWRVGALGAIEKGRQKLGLNLGWSQGPPTVPQFHFIPILPHSHPIVPATIRNGA